MLNGCLQSVSVLISVRDNFVNDSFLGKKPPSCIHEEGFVYNDSELSDGLFQRSGFCFFNHLFVGRNKNLYTAVFSFTGSGAVVGYRR